MSRIGAKSAPYKTGLSIHVLVQQHVGIILMLYSKEARWCSKSESDLILIENTCKKGKRISFAALLDGKVFLNINGYL